MFPVSTIYLSLKACLLQSTTNEHEGGVRIGLRVSNLYESVHTKGDNERGWKLVRTESRRDGLKSEFSCDGRMNYFLSTNQFFCFRVIRPRWHAELTPNR